MEKDKLIEEYQVEGGSKDENPIKASLVLHLGEHCTKSAAEKRFWELERELIREEDEDKERELEFLLDFLKKADFKKLRSQGFDEGKDMFVRIRKQGEDFIVEPE